MYSLKKLLPIIFLCILGIGLFSCKPKVKEKLITEFTPDKRNASAGDTVRFRYESVNFDKLSWDFGDGTFSETKNPIHIYTKAGSFYVTLRVIKGHDTASSADLKFTVLASNNAPIALVRPDSVIGRKELPVKKDSVIKAATIVIWPVTAYTGDIIGYSTKSDNPIVWDFGGKSSSEKTSGQVTFDAVGQFTVKLLDKTSGNILDSRIITILDKIDDNKFSTWLSDLANNKLSRTEKTSLSIKVYSYCLNNGEIPIEGKETGSFKDFIRKILIEANPYETVSISVNIQLNQNKKISSVQLATYDKKAINN